MSYGTQADWEAGEAYAREHPDERFGPADAVGQGLIESGEFVCAAGLSDPTHTQMVELRDGSSIVTDGPFAEDAVQEALLAAAVQWREEGVPDNPRG